MYTQLDRAGDLLATMAYHERKISLGKAELIHATNFFREPQDLSQTHIAQRFNQLLKLNKRCKKKLLHYSVSFYPEDKPRLNTAVLRDISEVVLRRLGLEGQPCLVYRHRDAPHPHIHILGPIIAPDGHVITCDRAVRDGRLRTLARDVEAHYGLQPPHTGRTRCNPEEAHRQPQKVIYGRRPMASAIGDVLEFIVTHYHYTSLDTFNGLLRQYNLKASPVDRQQGRQRRHGLVYYILDAKGRRAGPPLKASLFRCGVTLPKLEKHFEAHRSWHAPAARITDARIRLAARAAYDTAADFFRGLQRDRITALIDHEAGGEISRLTYVDHQTRWVFGEEELSEGCSARALLSDYAACGLKLTAPGKVLSPTATRQHHLTRSVANDLPEDSPLAEVLSTVRRQSPDTERMQERKRKALWEEHGDSYFNAIKHRI